MKKKLILAAAASAALAVGLTAACGTSTHTAQPVPTDKNCTELAKPADPHGLIGNEWPWPACSALSDATPGVDSQRADDIVYDARQRVAAAKRNISLLATMGNKEADPDAQAKFRSYIENLRGNLSDDLMNSRLALQGTPPEGFSLDYKNSPNPLSCADAWDFDKCIATGGKDKGQPPWYLQTHSASPAWTGTGR